MRSLCVGVGSLTSVWGGTCVFLTRSLLLMYFKSGGMFATTAGLGERLLCSSLIREK